MIIEITDDDINEFLEEYNLVNPNNQLDLDDTRKAAIKSWQDVKACPGSGKTTLIACKLIMLAKKWNDKYRAICVLTHTNVACDEIKARLTNDKYGAKLLSYPHFIGTIQEFINQYLAFPYLRGRYPFKKFIENEDDGFFSVLRANLANYSIDDICKNLYVKCNKAHYSDIQRYLGTLTYKNADLDLVFRMQHNSEECIKASSTAPRKTMLVELKETMLLQGDFQYQDMYCFAQMSLKCNNSLKDVISSRFPFVFIDEMQDTNLCQDELINSIFNTPDVKLQRFGDHDQAIFDGMSGEPNTSFNEINNQLILNSTHRFSQDIASKIHGLSVSQCGEISTAKKTGVIKKHTFFIFDDATKIQVLDKFAKLIQAENLDGSWKTVKAVGATEGKAGHIRAYWSEFEKNKTIKSDTLNKLIHAVKQARYLLTLENSHVSTSFQRIVNCVVKGFNRFDIPNNGVRGNYFTVSNLIGWLKREEKIISFRKLVHDWLFVDEVNESFWTSSINELKQICEITVSNSKFDEFTEFNINADINNAATELKSSSANIYQSQCGVNIEVGTIHSVKGETHDATLVLETKYKSWCDTHILLDKLTLQDSQSLLTLDLSKEKNSQKIKFSRQLFVAASRPEHVLCFAIHTDHINDSQKVCLEQQGWSLDYV